MSHGRPRDRYVDEPFELLVTQHGSFAVVVTGRFEIELSGTRRLIAEQPLVRHDERRQITEFERPVELEHILEVISVGVVLDPRREVLDPRLDTVGCEFGHEIRVVSSRVVRRLGSAGLVIPVPVVRHLVVVPTGD